MSSCAFIGIRLAFRKPVACVFSHTQASQPAEIAQQARKGMLAEQRSDMPCTAFHILDVYHGVSIDTETKCMEGLHYHA